MAAEDGCSYASEKELCSAFREHLESFEQDKLKRRWRVFPEQGSWDLLLQLGRVQIGVQAKLKAINQVLLQTLPENEDHTLPGPQYRAVLIGGYVGRSVKARVRQRGEFFALARALKIIVFEPWAAVPNGALRFGAGYLPLQAWAGRGSGNRGIPHRFIQLTSLDLWHYRFDPITPEWTPPFVPEIEAGVPSPKAVGPWQVCAVELERICRRRGWIALDDVRAIAEKYGGRFTPSTMLSRYFECTGETASGRQKRWRLNRWAERRPSKLYPEVAKGLDDAGVVNSWAGL